MNSDLTDEELIWVYFPNQPRHCFEMLYQRYYLRVYQQCLALTRCPNLARDYTQDIFIKVFHKLGTFQQRARFTTWLYALAFNYCRDQMRLGERLATIEIDAYLEMSLVDPTESLSQQERLARFSRALASLSFPEQALIRLKYEQGLSLQALAHQYGVSISAVKMRLKRSRAKIQQSYIRQLAS